jgi:hypothetical protein
LFSLGVLLDNQKGQFFHSDVKKNYYGFFSRKDDKIANSIEQQKKSEEKLNALIEKFKKLCGQAPKDEKEIQKVITELNGFVSSESLITDYNDPYVIDIGNNKVVSVSLIKAVTGDSVFDELLAYKNFVGDKNPNRIDEENYNKPTEQSFLQLQNILSLWAGDSKSISEKCSSGDIKLLSDYMTKNTELNKMKTSLLKSVSLRETNSMFLSYIGDTKLPEYNMQNISGGVFLKFHTQRCR